MTRATRSLARPAFGYDSFNRQNLRTEDTNPQAPGETLVEHFVYDRDNVLLDFFDPDGDWTASFPQSPALALGVILHGPAIDMVLAQDACAGSVSWLLADHLGSTPDRPDR